MPVYRLSSIKQTSHLLFSNQTYRIQSEQRLSDRYLLFRCSSETEREPPTDTTNNNSLLFHLKAKSQSQSLQNINCWTQKTVNWRTKKQEITTNQPLRSERRFFSLFGHIFKINEPRKCDQKKKHWCFFRVAYFWTTWPTLFNCRFKHSQTLNEAAELSVYRKSLWAFFFFSNKFTTWN